MLVVAIAGKIGFVLLEAVIVNTATDITLRNYTRIMGQLLIRPRVFFSTLPHDLGMKRPMLMLVVSSVIYVAACGSAADPPIR